MNKFIRYLLKKICARLVRQGNTHCDNIKEYYSIMGEAMEKEFKEDSGITLEFFQKELLEKSFKKGS